jgi:TPR repeat protein
VKTSFLILILCLSPLVFAGLQNNKVCSESRGLSCVLNEFGDIASQSNLHATKDLSAFYDKDYGLSKEFDEGMKQLHEAAENGDVIVQYFLGLIYEHGQLLKHFDYIV